MGNENNIFLLNTNYKEQAESIKLKGVSSKYKKLAITTKPSTCFSIYDRQSNINGYRTAKAANNYDNPFKKRLYTKKAKEFAGASIQSNAYSSVKAKEQRENIEPNMNKDEERKHDKDGLVEERNIKKEPQIVTAAYMKQGGAGDIIEGKGEEVKEEEHKVLMKPIIRIHTGLNLSEAVEKVEGSNGPILNTDDPEENRKTHHTLYTEQKLEGINGVKVEYKNGVKVEDDEIIKIKDDHKVKPKVIEEAKQSEPCYWKLPMSQWPKCKAKMNKEKEEPIIEIPRPVKEPEILRKPTLENPENESEGENQATNTPLYKFVAGFSLKAKDDEEGDDACFACERGLGVSDGVSGWSTYGINPSAFSQKLSQECEKEIRRIAKLKKEQFTDVKRARIPKVASYVGLDFQANTIYNAGGSDAETSEAESESNMPEVNKRPFEIPLDALQILETSYNKITEIGSATSTIVVINKNEVHATNLGDSGFIHLSQKEGKYYINHISKEQQHEFNVPFQLSCFPSEEYLLEMEREGRGKEAKQLRFMIEKKKLCKDDPDTADVYTYKVNNGDIFVLGTDGIFDNVFSYEIKDIIKNCMLNVTKITNRVAKVV